MAKSELTKEERSLFQALHKDRAASMVLLKKKSLRGVWASIIDKYPESAHFVYELLQNADDANAKEVHIEVNEDELIFRHNGTVAFNVTDDEDEPVGHINSITSIGNSSKIEDEGLNKIGKFGVGFKSVFQYTDTPEIFDDKFRFKIENYIVPVLLGHDFAGRKKGETLFRIPFKEGLKRPFYKEIVTMLQNLDNPILFLHNVEKMSWSIKGDENSSGLWTKQCVYSEIIGNIEFSDLSLNDSDILFFSRLIRTDAKETSTLQKVSVGYFWNRTTKKLVRNRRPNLYCFFPTSETLNSRFIAHAPFRLTDSRQNLNRSRDRDWNATLISEIAKLAADALLIIRDYGLKNEAKLLDVETLFHLIPYNINTEVNYYHDTLTEGRIVYKPFVDIIKKEALFLSASGAYLTKDEILFTPSSDLLDLLDRKMLTELNSGICRDFINVRKKLIEDYERIIQIKDFDAVDLAKLLTPEFMKKRSKEWLVKFYRYLLEKARQLWNATDINKNKNLYFRYAPIVKLQDGSWVPPYKDGHIDVFFPLDNSSENYNFIDQELLRNKTIHKFFDELGAKVPEQTDYVYGTVLPRYQCNPINIDFLKKDFDTILGCYKSLSIHSAKKEFVERVRTSIFLKCQKKKISIDRPNNLYFKRPMLVSYFANENNWFVDVLYYVGKYSEDEVVDFMRLLGVRDDVGITEYITESEESSSTSYRLSFDCSERQKAKLGILWVTQYWKCTDYEFDGLQKYLKKNNISKEWSSYIWDVLTKTDLSLCSEMTVKYFYRVENIVKCESTLMDVIKYSAWLYTKNGVLVTPGQTFAEDLDDGLYRMDRKLLEVLGIKRRNSILKEKGFSDEDIASYELGARAMEYGLTEEDLKEAAERKKRSASLADSCANAVEESESEKNVGSSDKQNNLSKEALDNSTPERNKNLKVQESQKLTDCFADKKPDSSSKSVSNASVSWQDALADKQSRLQDEFNEMKDLEELRQSVKGMERYSFEWFKTLLKLEYSNSRIDEGAAISRSVHLRFSSIKKDAMAERSLILSNADKAVPIWLEDCEDIAVTFSFSNQEDMCIKFDFANVRGFSLHVKSKSPDAETIRRTDWSQCTKATIEMNNPAALMGQWCNEFTKLPLAPDDNMRDHLRNNIKFIFGPPGTGKTTEVTKQIFDLMAENEKCRILVLAPTNKACDVICKTLVENEYEISCSSWLGRFVQTGDDELSAFVVDRNSDLILKDQCCIISTMARLPYDCFTCRGGNYPLRDVEWDYVILDESSMIPLAQTVFALYKFGEDTQFIISGDPLQIGPIVNEELWKDENIYKMVQLTRFSNPKTVPVQYEIQNLTTQYRSVPAIGELFSLYSYNGKLEHYRKADDQRKVEMPYLPLKPINFIPFRVEQFDSIYGPKKLSGSNVHIYSVLLAVEFCKSVAHQIPKDETSPFSIGIICPYAPQAELIEKLIQQTPGLENVRVTTGTVHRFQGDQCNMIIAVMNPPRAIKGYEDKIFVNNKNIINVAISRASDYLCILMPNKSTKNYEYLKELNELLMLAKFVKEDVSVYDAGQVESSIFGNPRYIEENTFVTCHQLANVYNKPNTKYEFRIDELAADIQLNE